MQPPSAAHRPGFLLIEILLGTTLFVMFVTAAFLTMLVGQEGSFAGGDRMRAVRLSQQAIEAARTLRDADFSNLSDGTHGVAIGPAGTWVLSGSYVTGSGGFRTELTVTTLASDWKRVSAKTTWSHGRVSSGAVFLDEEFTDWRLNRGGDWSVLTLTGSYTDAGTPLFNDAVVSGDYLFVTSDVSGGGAGLYIFDMSDATSPSRVANSFDLGNAGYDLATVGTTLFVAVDDNNGEVHVYDISDPASFSASDLLDTHNIGGNGRARALALDGNTLFVGATYATQGSQEEFYAIDVSTPSSMSELDALDDTGNMNAIALTGTSAYIASGMDSSEIRVVDVSDTSDLQFAPGAGYNLTDTPDALAIAITNTGTLVGRSEGDATEEFVRADVEGGSGVPTPPPGPWFREIDGDVNDIAVDATQCAAFLASAFDDKELSVVNIRDSLLPELTFYDATSGAGRGVHHDPVLDLLFLMTNTAVHIFAPDPGPWTCP